MESKDPRKDFVTVQQRNSIFSKFGKNEDCSFLLGTEPHQKVIRAHRAILAVVSPVFNMMFFGAMAERKYPIRIPDIEPATFMNMLRYIYGIKISKYDITLSSIEDACNVYYAANKYILPRLKSKCTGYIYSRLCRHNKHITKYICPVYEFASLYEEERIKIKCLEIMKNYTREIINDNNFYEARLSTLVTIYSLEKIACTELDLFNALERYVKAQWDEDRDPIEYEDKANPIKSEDKAKPIECGDKADSTERENKEDTAESENKAEHIECGDKADSSESENKAEHIECGDKADSSESENKADTAECGDKIDTIESEDQANHIECENKADPTESEDKAGPIECWDKAFSAKCEEKGNLSECSISMGARQMNVDSVAKTEPERQHGDPLAECKIQVNIRPALEKIRFLTLTADQFFEGPAQSGLLTESEVFAILLNIMDEPHVPMPAGFSTCKKHRSHNLLTGEVIAAMFRNYF